MQRRFLEEHMTSQCRNRIVQCEHCGEEFAFWRTEVHEGEKCDRFPLECPQKCGVREIPREEVESHVRDDCLMTIVVCPYEGAGCTFNDKRINLGAHIEESVREHLSKTWSELTQTKQELNEVKKIEGNVEEIQDRLEKLQSEKESMEISLQRNSGEISDLKLSEKKLEVENLSLRKEVTELGRRLTQVSVTTDLADIEHCSLKNLVQTMKIQFKAIQTRLEATEKGEELKAVPKKPQNDIPYPVLDEVLAKGKKKKPQTDIPYPVLDEDLPKEKKQPPGLQKKTEDNPMNRWGRRRYFP